MASTSTAWDAAAAPVITVRIFPGSFSAPEQQGLIARVHWALRAGSGLAPGPTPCVEIVEWGGPAADAPVRLD